ncbi:hypothetical protein [Nostoc sp. 'Lobaria pulmonaria (5183) cyanobiont']|uniref:hypothetical protein n=1 Tax=Nostoc sp. 'Lobaria pulmonaria (5183) cyanobiont' TaxID=1618022 RepID=UPI000CF30070|nr:hypothetical protein [Nostoc sp. 'Lobaria pulmonaria (5183) cyanobiont']AVH69642.1 hypothetical protein NLP_0779 [Nostoc sp. 'Lobaria pulmonaria (5183) cyanobiont']
MHQKFAELVNQCRRPTVELLREVLLCRREFSEAESNFITYIAGFSHHEFAESLFSDFNLAFLEGTSIFFDRDSNKFHFKILINDQSHHCKKLHLGSIADNYNSPGFGSRMAFRDQNGLYIDSLGKQLRGLPGHQVKAYIAQGISGITENVVSYQRDLQGYCLVTHFVIAAEPNVDINLKTIFGRVTACIFVNILEKSGWNLSLCRFEHRDDLYPLLKNICWYVLDARQPEKIIDFLQKIGADFKLMQYAGKEHDYLQEVLPEIETMILEILSRF